MLPPELFAFGYSEIDLLLVEADGTLQRGRAEQPSVTTTPVAPQGALTAGRDAGRRQAAPV